MAEKEERYRKYTFILALIIITAIVTLEIYRQETSNPSKEFSIIETEAIQRAVYLTRSLVKTELVKNVVLEIQSLLRLPPSKDRTEIFNKFKVEMDKAFELNDSEFGKAVSIIESIIINHFPDDQFNVCFRSNKDSFEAENNNKTPTNLNTDYGKQNFKYYLGYRLLLLNGLDKSFIISIIPKKLSLSGWTTYFTELAGFTVLLNSVEVYFSPPSDNTNYTIVDKMHKINEVLVTPFKISKYDYKLKGGKDIAGCVVQMQFSGDPKTSDNVNAYSSMTTIVPTFN